MKNFLKATLIGLLIGTQAYAGLAPTNAVTQAGTSLKTHSNITAPNNQFTDLGGLNALLETGNTNLLANANFQAKTVTSGWTTGGSGLAVTADTTNYLDLGPQSALLTFTASTTGTFSQTITPTNIAQFSGVNMEASAWVKTTATTLQVCALVGGTATNCQAVPSAGTWQRVTANFIGPASGSFGIQIQTSASLTGTGNLGFSYVGRATNLSQVSQAQLLGSVTFPGASSCSWSVTSTTYTNATANASCATPTVTGVFDTTAGKIPGAHASSLPPGEYLLIANSKFGISTGANGQFRFSDGTNATNGGAVFSSSGTYSQTISGRLSYTTAQSGVTIQVQSASASGSTVIDAGFASPASGFELLLYYFPSQSQTGVRADQTPATAGSQATDNVGLAGSTSSSTAGVLGSISGSLTNISTPRNITCTTASGTVGVTCTLPVAGNYHVCYSGYAYNSIGGSDESLELLVDGSGSTIVGAQEQAGATANNSNAFGGCNNHYFNAGSNTIQVYGRIIGGGTSTFALTTISINGADATTSAPYLTGSVTSNGQSQVRQEFAVMTGAVCSSGTCPLTSNSGGISSITWQSTGSYSVNFAAGTFSAPPACTPVSMSFGTSWASCEMNGLSTSSSALVLCRNVGASPANQNDAIAVTCTGPR